MEIFLKPQGTHFGVDPKHPDKKSGDNGQSEPAAFVKQFYSLPKEKIGSKKVDVPLKDVSRRILDIPALAEKMKVTKDNQSSTFALRMLEAAPKVVFKSK